VTGSSARAATAGSARVLSYAADARTRRGSRAVHAAYFIKMNMASLRFIGLATPGDLQPAGM
jgi:hypothetical protein